MTDLINLVNGLAMVKRFKMVNRYGIAIVLTLTEPIIALVWMTVELEKK